MITVKVIVIIGIRIELVRQFITKLTQSLKPIVFHSFKFYGTTFLRSWFATFFDRKLFTIIILFGVIDFNAFGRFLSGTALNPFHLCSCFAHRLFQKFHSFVHIGFVYAAFQFGGDITQDIQELLQQVAVVDEVTGEVSNNLVCRLFPADRHTVSAVAFRGKFLCAVGDLMTKDRPYGFFIPALKLNHIVLKMWCTVYEL